MPHLSTQDLDMWVLCASLANHHCLPLSTRRLALQTVASSTCSKSQQHTCEPSLPASLPESRHLKPGNPLKRQFISKRAFGRSQTSVSSGMNKIKGIGQSNRNEATTHDGDSNHDVWFAKSAQYIRYRRLGRLPTAIWPHVGYSRTTHTLAQHS